MRNLRLKSTSRRLLLVAGFAGLPLTSAVAHEGHHVECNETAINALKADIQAVSEGEAKTTATKELEAAQQMMAMHYVTRRSCELHAKPLNVCGNVAPSLQRARHVPMAIPIASFKMAGLRPDYRPCVNNARCRAQSLVY